MRFRRGRRRFPTTRRGQKKRSFRRLTRRYAMPRSFNKIKELHSIDVQLADGANPIVPVNTATGFWLLLNGIAAGTGFWNRNGNQIMMTRLTINTQITYNTGTTASTGDYITFGVLYDRQPNGALPTSIGGVFATMPPGGTPGMSSPLPATPRNLNTRDRFVVLWRELVSTPNNYSTTEAAANTVSPWQDADLYRLTSKEISIPLKNLATVYSGTTSAIGDVSSGSLLFFAFGNNSSSGAAFSILGNSRLRYYD